MFLGLGFLWFEGWVLGLGFVLGIRVSFGGFMSKHNTRMMGSNKDKEGGGVGGAQPPPPPICTHNSRMMGLRKHAYV